MPWPTEDEWRALGVIVSALSALISVVAIFIAIGARRTAKEAHRLNLIKLHPAVRGRFTYVGTKEPPIHPYAWIDFVVTNNTEAGLWLTAVRSVRGPRIAPPEARYSTKERNAAWSKRVELDASCAADEERSVRVLVERPFEATWPFKASPLAFEVEIRSFRESDRPRTAYVEVRLDDRQVAWLARSP